PMRWAIMRMLTSVGPPAGNGTTILIAWVGNGTERSAWAMAGATLPVATIRKAAVRMDRMFIVPLRARMALPLPAGRLNLSSPITGGRTGGAVCTARPSQFTYPVSAFQRYAFAPSPETVRRRRRCIAIAWAAIRPYHALRKAQA